jgi:hypothetical protein
MLIVLDVGDSMNDLNIDKNEIICVRYCDDSGRLTHVLCKKLNAEANKMWILLSVEDDGSTKKVAQGASPLKLEDKIDYIKAIKDKE